jgi:peptide/nickel transport system substrate-binding protein
MKKMFSINACLLILLPFLKVQSESKIFRYALKGDIRSMDPHHFFEGGNKSFLENIYEAPVRRDKNLKLIPALATEWENIAPTVWRFKLRQNVKFHDGTPFTAEDLIFSVARAKSPSSDFKGALVSIKEVKKIDDYTVDIITHEPDAILPDELISCPIMSKVWCEKHKVLTPLTVKSKSLHYADFHTNGTGAFKLKERVPDLKTVLIKHNAWWDISQGNVESVEMMPIHSDATRVSALLSGKIHMMTQVPLQDIQALRLNKALKIYHTQGNRTIFLGLNLLPKEGDEQKASNPLQNILARKALYQAINEEGLRHNIMRGFSQPAALMIAPSIGGYKADLDKRYPYDVNQAKQLLTQAGYGQGLNLSMECSNDRYIHDEKICTSLVGMFAKVGIHVNLTTKTKTKFFADLRKQVPSLYLFGWSASTNDAHGAFYHLALTKKEGQGEFNYGGYSNKQFDDLIQAAHKELNKQKRLELLGKAMEIHKQDIGHIPLHHEPVVWAAQKNVKLEQRPDDYFTFYKVSIQ